MRRSAAPSQQGLAPKRPRFNPPFRASSAALPGTPRPVPSHSETLTNSQGHLRTPHTTGANEFSNDPVREALSIATKQGEVMVNDKLSVTLGGKSDNVASQTSSGSIPVRTSVTPGPGGEDFGEERRKGHTDIFDKVEAKDVLESAQVGGDGAPGARLKDFGPPKRGPLQRKPFMVRQITPTVKPATETVGEDEGPKRHYYNVMWCKLSKKKHKKWEGDALLITKGRSVTLLDIEGKEIGKGSGYRPSELESMEEGHTLCVGGKEIEVMGSISEEDWTTGKCFQTGSSSTTSTPHGVPLPSKAPRPSKPFSNPQKTGASGSSTMQTKMVPPRASPRPLYDPTHPDALVMPRPPSSHQWQNNPKNESVVDVVVDPHLAMKLRPHQRAGVLFLYECIMGLRQYQGNGAILADEMGLGKTLQCITLIWTLYKQGPYGGKPIIKRVLIVTPGSLVKNWCREFRKWLGPERISVFPVSSDKKVEEFKKSPLFPVMIISYEMMVRYTDDIRGITFDLVVCDEGHRLKNSTIKTASFLSSLSVRRRILLTGTPIQNDLQEFYSIVEFCNPGVLGTSASFHRVYEEPILRSNQPSATKEEKVLGAARATELSRLTSLFVLRRTQEINNKYLPPKVETVVFCEPSPLQLRLYQHLLRSPLIRSCLSRGYTPTASASSPHLVCIGALKKLCNDPSLLYEASKKADEAGEMKGGSWTLDDDEEESLYKGLLSIYPSEYSEGKPLLAHCGKLYVLSEMLKAMHADQTRKERLVLVSNYTQTLDILQALCSMEGYRFCRLDGSTPTTKRQSIVEHFNSTYAKETIFLLSSKAGGVGLNLIGASRLLLYDTDWNPANDLQAMARVWRDGQKKTVHIYRLITAGTIEEKIYQRQISKQSLSGAVVDAKIQGGSVKFSLEELRDLFTLHEGSSCLTHDMLACDCTEMDGSTADVKSSDSTQRDVLRPCQLGRPQPQTTKKNLSMGDLNEWHHYPAPLSEDFQDEYLLASKERITFVFQNETNMVPVS